MSLRFILGRAGTGKTKYCFEEVRNVLRQTPDGPPLIYIVPDQMTFETEYEIAKTPDLKGMTRFNVYSFSRLALRVLQQAGGITRYHLNRSGMMMVIRKIIEHHKDELRVFQKASEQKGFYDVLHTTITEFKQYCLTPGDLYRKYERLEEAAGESGEKLLKDKLYDMQFIYTQLENALLNKYVDSEDYLKLFIEKADQTTFFQDAEVWIDGFDSFTPREIEALVMLMKQAKHVTVTLTVDRAYDDIHPGELSLFRKTAQTYRQIRQSATDHSINIQEPVLLNESIRFNEPALNHLEKYYERRPAAEAYSGQAICLSEAVNRREEIEQAARDVLRLVRDEGLRYRDIAVLVRDLSIYHELTETIFKDYQIPVFIDQKRPMRHHSLIEFIRSAIDVIQQNWRYEPVFRCIKTDLIFPFDADLHQMREQMDGLENYCISYGIYGGAWKQNKPWQYRQYRGLREKETKQTDEELDYQKEINRLRELIREPLLEFESDMKAAKTILDKCTVLYEFLLGLSVPEKIERLRNQAEASGRLDEAREHDQVWGALMDCLDQFVEAAGSEEMSLEIFAKVLDTGLDSLHFSLVPPALDQVLVGSIDRTRLSNTKAVFILGANEGILPAKPDEDHVFSDEDRQLLEDYGIHLAEGTRSQILDEEFLIYRAMTSASDKLFISYPLAAEDGQSLMASPLIGRLKSIFPDINVRFIPAEPHEVIEEKQLNFVTTPGKTIGRLASQIRQWDKGYPVADLWWDVYNWYTESDQWSRKSRNILSSLFYQNQERLNPDTAKSLFGTTIRASVSRMELFNACPFAQFASYGLRLKEREVYRLEAPDIGELFHSAIKLMTEALMKDKRSWADVSVSECEEMAFNTVNRLAPKLQREILLSSHRHQYLQHKLEQVIIRAAKVMRQHAMVSGFSPVGLELPFGPKQPIPPLTFELPNGCRMELAGRIDRVDKGEGNTGMLLRIIDYKSSAKDLSLTDIYFGLALQMITYLDVILTFAKDWLGAEATPAGVLYFHVHNPMLNETKKLTESDLEYELMKQFKMRGLILADEEVAKLMDQSMASKSDILPVSLKKDGGFMKYSSVADDESFQTLRRYVRQVIIAAGTSITEGNIRISPYKLKDKTPCQYCSFKSVCQFDQSQNDNNYRQLRKENDEDILRKMIADGGADSGNAKE
ncbi:helicase-exonuclease AddAB subunit AddB [Scopulibacillus cellulosilyticus]|uniref:ATP-dependent helicase/deoxyribonuclease subunit B n=1 Tax=Scopulibacillus cellulosilyticus TaxID=2665665 RepID=A0ABW2PU65_9BACL